MADDPNISDGFGGTVSVSADEAAGKYLQRVKLAYSADGVATHVTADSSGLLVNLGANNDVTVTSGTITVGGTASVSVAGTATVNLGVDNDVTLNAGTNRVGYVGISADGTAIATMLSLTSGTAVSVGVLDTSGVQVNFAGSAYLSTTFTTAGTYIALDNIGTTTPASLASAVSGTGLVGHIVGASVVDLDDLATDIYLHFFRNTVTTPANNAAWTVSDSDMQYYVGTIDTSADGSWFDMGASQAWTMTRSPIPFHCNATTLYVACVAKGGFTLTSGFRVNLYGSRE